MRVVNIGKTTLEFTLCVLTYIYIFSFVMGLFGVSKTSFTRTDIETDFNSDTVSHSSQFQL